MSSDRLKLYGVEIRVRPTPEHPATVPIALAHSAIWAVPATLATIATYGGAAAAAPGMIALAEGITMAESLAAFAKGGRPEPGKLALVGEEGPELFIPDSAGTIFTARQTASMMATPKSVGGNGGGSTVNNELHFAGLFDSHRAALNAMQSDEGQQWLLDFNRRTAHLIRPS